MITVLVSVTDGAVQHEGCHARGRVHDVRRTGVTCVGWDPDNTNVATRMVCYVVKCERSGAYPDKATRSTRGCCVQCWRTGARVHGGTCARGHWTFRSGAER